MLTTATPEQATNILAEGNRWEGEGLNTSKACRRLVEACGVALVSGDFELYKNAFLFSLALSWGVEIQQLDLTEKGSEAAFSLSSCYCDFGGPSWDDSGLGSSRAGEEEDDEAPGRLTLAWDEVEDSLPAEMNFIYEEVKAGRRRLDLNV